MVSAPTTAEVCSKSVRSAVLERADVVARLHCCSDLCLLNSLGYDRGKELVYRCLIERDTMTRSERKDHLRVLVRNSITCTDRTGSGAQFCRFNWKVGDIAHVQLEKVCKDCFCNCYGVSSSHVDTLIKEVKGGVVNSSKALSDKTTVMKLLPQLRKVARAHGINLTQRQVAAASLPNSPYVLTCYGWMCYHFKLVGDYIPNSGGEIHLEPIKIVEVYDEYVADMSNAGVKKISVDIFASIWVKCFEHVKIREYKAVTGKCETCTQLSFLRRTFKADRDREYITAMHALHRTAYMGERQAYAERRNMAIMQKSKYMSTISDGMAQGHNQLPHMANQNQWQGNEALPQHLQGILNHNRGMTIYRTFHTVNNCANVAMHSFLLELERVMQEEGKLPDTIYHQIDGGSENTARAWFGLCELIVARRLCKRLVLTRLMVGHTHEDIDSKFGVLWKGIRNRFVYTPQQYHNQIVRALSTTKHQCNVVDIIAIPDYKSLLDECIDPSFSPMTKKEKTQLQWSFEAVTPDEIYFTNGVRVLYRAYASEEHVSIITDMSKSCGVHAKATDVFWFPHKNPEAGIMVDGMKILRRIPSRRPSPYPFTRGCRDLLDDVMVKVETSLGTKHPAVSEEWRNWEKDMPRSDDVEEYIREGHPLHVPLGHLLFNDEPPDRTAVLPLHESAFSDLQRMRTTDCVKWSRWGYKRDDHCAEHNARVEWTYIGGERVEQNALPMQPKVFRKWKERYKLKDDELPGASFILAKRRLNDPTAPFDREGQVFSLRNGTQKRVYWKYSRNPTVIDNGTPSSLESNLESGLWKLGRLEAPSDQISVDYAPEDLPPDDVEITATAARRADGGCDSDRSGRCRRRKHKNYVESNSSDEDELNSSDEDELNSSDEEEQEVTESELEKCVSESSDEFSSSDGEDEIQFKVGEKVRNIHGLNGIVTAVNGKLYDVTYIDGRTDRLKSLYLRPQVVRNKVGSNRTMTAGSYTYVAHDDQWVDSGSIRADNVVAGKRKRASVTSYRT